MKKTVLSLLILVMIFQLAQAQLQKSPAVSGNDWQLGLGLGYTNYYGDLSNYRITRFSDLTKTWRFADFNSYYIPKPSLSLLLQKKINPTLGLILQLNQVEFSMSDRYRYKGGTLAYDAPNFARSLNFSTRLRDAGIALHFTTANGRFMPENAFFYPSFFLGGGIAQFDVKGDLYDANNNPYNYTVQAQINDGSFETNLRDAKTETQNRYANTIPYLDLGLALNFRLSNSVSLSVQSDIKYAGSDYLDDVSGQYKTNYPSAASAYIAHPGYNNINPVTRQRGDITDMNDMYINNRLVLNIRLASHKKKAPAFRAPTIYSLSRKQSVPPLHKVALKTAAGIAAADSQHRAITDTILILKDSSNRAADTGYSRRVENKLDSLQGQLKKIKTVLRNQVYEQRYQYLQKQIDSVAAMKTGILNRKVINNEDRLRLRIADLQADSLQRELNSLQRRAEMPMEDTDSSWSLQPMTRADVNSHLAVLPAGIDAAGNMPDSINLPADTITDVQFSSLTQQIAKLRKEKKYKTDSSYRKNIDSLNKKLNEYQVAQQRALKVQYVTDSINRIINRADSARSIDSLYTDSVTTAAVSVLEQRVQLNKDSLARLQVLIKQTRDSASFYRRSAFAAQTAADSAGAAPRKWYRRILPSGKKNNNTLNNEVSDANDREQYYDRQLDKLNQQVNTLQRNKAALSSDYDRERQRTERVYLPAPPALREPARQNTTELRELRNEINALRSQLLVQPTVIPPPVVPAPPRRANDTIYVQAAPRMDTTQSHISNAQALAMQQEIAQLKAALAAITPPATAVPVEKGVAQPAAETVTVYFAMGASTLAEAQADKLSALKKSAAVKTYRLTGYTDAVGNVAANNALAHKRMQFVRNLLVTQLDVPADHIHLEEPVTAGEKGRKPNALDRKVTVQVK